MPTFTVIQYFMRTQCPLKILHLRNVRILLIRYFARNLNGIIYEFNANLNEYSVSYRHICLPKHKEMFSKVKFPNR